MPIEITRQAPLGLPATRQPARDHARDNAGICAVKGNGYLCTRAPGHAMPHVAHTADNPAVAILEWTGEDERLIVPATNPG